MRHIFLELTSMEMLVLNANLKSVSAEANGGQLLNLPAPTIVQNLSERNVA